MHLDIEIMIYTNFPNLCNALQFSLYSAMQAVELMDPKMDTGLCSVRARAMYLSILTHVFISSTIVCRKSIVILLLIF